MREHDGNFLFGCNYHHPRRLLGSSAPKLHGCSQPLLHRHTWSPSLSTIPGGLFVYQLFSSTSWIPKYWNYRLAISYAHGETKSQKDDWLTHVTQPVVMLLPGLVPKSMCPGSGVPLHPSPASCVPLARC